MSYKAYKGKAKYTSQGDKNAEKCWRCGLTNHSHKMCRFKNEKCFGCSKIGHTIKVCKHTCQVVSEEETDSLDVYHINSVSNTKGIMIPITVENADIKMQLDTAADVSIITLDTYQRYFRHLDIQPANVLLNAHNDEHIPVVGNIEVQI